MPPVARIEHDQLERRRPAVLATLAFRARALFHAVDVHDHAERILERDGLDVAGGALEHDVEHGVGPDRLEARLLDEPVVDLLELDTGHVEAAQPHADLGRAGRSQVGQTGGRLDHDPGERRVRAEAQLLEGHAGVHAPYGHLGRRRGGAGGAHAWNKAAQTLVEEVGRDEPAFGGHARRSLEDHRLALKLKPRLVAAELGAPLGDGQRTGLALDHPGTLEKAGEALCRDIGDAVIHYLERQLTQDAPGALDLDGSGPSGSGLGGRHPRQDGAAEHERGQDTCHQGESLGLPAILSMAGR